MRLNRERRWLHGFTAGATAIGMAACIVLCASANAQAGRAKGLGEGDAKRGKELYIGLACYQCHGYEGQGAPGAGVRLGPDPMPAEAMAAVIRKDNGMMPPYTAKLVPDKDVADIVAYLKTVMKPTDIKNVPDFKK